MNITLNFFKFSAYRLISASNYVNKSPTPLSDYAKKLDPKVKRYYEEKIAAVGMIEGKYFQPDCLPLVESTDLLFYLVLETSYYTKQQFRSFRRLEAYNRRLVCYCCESEIFTTNERFTYSHLDHH